MNDILLQANCLKRRWFVLANLKRNPEKHHMYYIYSGEQIGIEFAAALIGYPVATWGTLKEVPIPEDILSIINNLY